MHLRTTRRLPGAVAVVAAALALALSSCGEATPTTADQLPGDPVRIGALTSFTGPFTPWGVQTRAGMQLAADELNAAGGIDGRPIVIVDADDRNDPALAVTEFERMVEQDGVVAVGGIISSSVGVVTAEAAEELEVPLLVVKAGSTALLTPTSRHTFRTCLPAAPMTAPPLLQFVEQEGMTRVGAIIADYAWGRAIEASLVEAFAGTGVTLRVEVAPVGETDFTTQLRALEDFAPDVLVATGHPPGAGPITVQSADLGFEVPVVGPYSPLANVVDGVGDTAFDRYADYACADFSDPAYQALAARFAAASEFDFMEGDAVAGFGIVQAVAAAVAAVGDDPADVAAHLHAGRFEVEGLAHPLVWTAWGELAEAAPVLSILRQQEPPEGILTGEGWYPEVLTVSEPLTPHEP